MTPLQLVQFLAAVVAIVVGIAALGRFIWNRRVTVSGRSELLNDGLGRLSEAFVFYVRSQRDHPVKIEEFGIYGQDSRGKYRQINVGGVPLIAAPVSKGVPYRVEIPFGYLAEFGLDVGRRIYGFARLAHPGRVIWSRRLTAGRQRAALTRSLPRPLSRTVGLPPTQPPPWWVRWFR